MDKEAFVRAIGSADNECRIFDITLLEEKGIADIGTLPFSIKILVENVLRKLGNGVVNEQDLLRIARWQTRYEQPVEIPYYPARVLMQDFTGVPAIVDLAAMRDAVKDAGGDPIGINPLVPVDLIVDHSVQVDHFGTRDALGKNVVREYARNGERYALLKWAQASFSNFRVVPPNSGICHQVNLEYLGRVVLTEERDGRKIAYPDTLVGTDSHTTMIDAIGVMGWGVGGIEAEAVMLGQPYYLSIPQVVGVKMTGALQAGTTATDLVLAVTELLRKHDVVEKFVEYFGPGMARLSVPDRATIANMTPEYGATVGFFPVDEKTIEYLVGTNRREVASLVETYTRAMGLFYCPDQAPVRYSEVIEIDLSGVEPCVAGPARPQDRIVLRDLKKNVDRLADSTPLPFPLHPVDLHGKAAAIGNGSIVIAAITSCTNTSNPSVMLGAGLVAKRAVEKGLKPPAHVKTSFAPGSKVVVRYLEEAGLMPYLEALGFHTAAYGCTTCIGNSGPLHPAIEKTIREHNLTVAAVLSGNRNFEARIHQSVKSNFLASPMLVVAFALAGRIDTDTANEPIGLDPDGEPVYLADLWPTEQEIADLVRKHVKTAFFQEEYDRIFAGDAFWNALETTRSTTFPWDPQSTYIKNPPYFDDFTTRHPVPSDIKDAAVLMVLGDSVTTDHISPAGAVPPAYPAGRYLMENGVLPADFNSYGSRRGNHEVMIRGTFGNIRIKNRLVAPKEGSFTVKSPENREVFVYDAAMAYRADSRPLVVLAGKEYGSGSSRDWAAKGTALLGVKAVIAESFERIHRSNLVGMGVLPLVFADGQSAEGLGLTGFESITITGVAPMRPRKALKARAVAPDGREREFEVIARLDTDGEVDYYEHGGILHYVLRKVLGTEAAS